MSCRQCDYITHQEEELLKDADSLTRKVLSACAPVRERNNMRWRRFARLCKIPLLGYIIFSLRVKPRGLEEEPKYEMEDWFKKGRDRIEALADEIEKKKRKHMCETSRQVGECDGSGCFGDEIVPFYHMDICGNIEYIHRWYLYEKYGDDAVSSLPLALNFRCERGRVKLLEGAVVMTADTKEIVPLTQCEQSNEVYFKKRSDDDEITAGR